MPGGSKAKTSFSLKKARSAVFRSSLIVKVSSSADKTAAPTLISLAAAMLAPVFLLCVLPWFSAAVRRSLSSRLTES